MLLPLAQPMTTSKSPLAIALAAALVASTGVAAESSALVDALVRKGVLTTTEAEEIRADLAREASTDSASKIKLSSSLTELKLYGDLRLRYQYDNKDLQANPAGVGIDNRDEDRSPTGSQRSRWRFRLRLNADFKLGSQVFGGVELSTARASDSGNQTFEDGFSDYDIFISRAWLGWEPAKWLTLYGGKMPNPFYTTDLVWDSDIAPTGVAEVIRFHQLFAPGQTEGGYAKDGKTLLPVTAAELPWELTLVAGQFIFDDNAESAFDNDESTDAYLFQTQLIGSYKFAGGAKLTLAPGWLTYINGSVTGAVNENPFNDNGNVSGATRNLNLLLLPGDVSLKMAGLKTKFFWDLSYNIEGRKRVEDIYNLVSLRTNPGGRPDPDDFDSHHSSQDDFAYQVGVVLGENKKKGDWSVLASWRQTGIGSVDPNLNDSDFAAGELNTRGFKLGLAYNFADFAIGGITYYHGWNLRDNLIGGEATGGNAIADSNAVQVLQLDIAVKF